MDKTRTFAVNRSYTINGQAVLVKSVELSPLSMTLNLGGDGLKKLIDDSDLKECGGLLTCSLKLKDGTSFEDFDSAIAHERSKQNYRNAVRLLHLKILRELEKNKFIRLSIDKTNYDYTRELKNSPLKQNFIGLTNHYNQIWYGNQTLSAPDYESLESSFQQYAGMINAQHE